MITAEGLQKAYGETLLFDELSFIVPPGAIVGVIGGNGTGKTTLFRMIVGHEAADGGTLRLGETVVLGHVDQSRAGLDAANTVWQEIAGGLDEIVLGTRKVNSRAYCAAFNFRGPDQQKKVGTLSGGERNRVHLAKTLRTGANLLLLDEPTNDLDVETLRALEEALQRFAGSVMVISHDRWFLDRIATHMLAFEGGKPRRVVRGQLRRLRGRPPPPPRREGRAAAPRDLQKAHLIGARRRLTWTRRTGSRSVCSREVGLGGRSGSGGRDAQAGGDTGR